MAAGPFLLLPVTRFLWRPTQVHARTVSWAAHLGLSEYVGRQCITVPLRRPSKETMPSATTASPTLREPQLIGQTVVVSGGSSGIGFETARRARAEGAGRRSHRPQPEAAKGGGTRARGIEQCRLRRDGHRSPRLILR